MWGNVSRFQQTLLREIHHVAEGHQAMFKLHAYSGTKHMMGGVVKRSIVLEVQSLEIDPLSSDIKNQGFPHSRSKSRNFLLTPGSASAQSALR